MLRFIGRCLFAAALLLPSAAGAEPITLKLSFFSSDRSMSYVAAVKPFVGAVNAEAKGLVEIKILFSGALDKDIARQPQLVLDGAADLAFVVPGYDPDQFPDNAVLELPGLFRDMREATLVYTRLVALGALRGYQDFFVVGAYATEPETIHGRATINSIADLKGKKIRVNNQGAFAALEKLGATPIPMPINQIADAISGKKIDAAEVALTPLADFGIKRVVDHHYLLGTDVAPLALLMSRKSFDALPKAAQDIIRKHSGDWAALRFIETYEASDRQVLEQLRSDPHRSIVIPSPSDLNIAHGAFNAVITQWASASSDNRELLDKTRALIAALRPPDGN